MKYEDNMTAISELQPDYLGFIFYKKSARYFETSIPKISKKIKTVICTTYFQKKNNSLSTVLNLNIKTF